MAALDTLSDWPVDNVAAAVIGPGDEQRTFGDIDRIFELASVTKLLSAMAVLIAHEEGTIDLDAAVTAGGATTADLLAHSGGIAPDEPTQMTPPRTRRIYSTAGYDIAAGLVAERAGAPWAWYLREAVIDPLGMGSTGLHGSAGAGARSTVGDLTRLMHAWRTPTLIHGSTLHRATTPHLGDLDGVLPGFGRQTPNPWGLGPEIRGRKSPHWTAPENAPSTYGHFGQSGTMVWIDPEADTTVIALTDRPFGPWAATVWPRFSALVLSD